MVTNLGYSQIAYSGNKHSWADLVASTVLFLTQKFSTTPIFSPWPWRQEVQSLFVY